MLCSSRAVLHSTRSMHSSHWSCSLRRVGRSSRLLTAQLCLVCVCVWVCVCARACVRACVGVGVCWWVGVRKCGHKCGREHGVGCVCVHAPFLWWRCRGEKGQECQERGKQEERRASLWIVIHSQSHLKIAHAHDQGQPKPCTPKFSNNEGPS